MALLLVVAEPFLFVGRFAGDAQVHLVFAEHASQGRLFEFNPGQRVSGETSPGYMLLGAMLFRCFPAAWVPLALKLLGGLAWYALWYVTYRVARHLFPRAADVPEDRAWPAIAASLAALVPGSIYDANVGMENGLFALIVWTWIDRASAWGWFERTPGSPTNQSWRRETVLALMLGLASWFRPEGLIIIVIAYAFRYRFVRTARAQWTAGLAAAALVGVSAYALEFAVTGDPIPISILSRRILAMQRAPHLGPVLFDPGLIKRLLAYSPLSACFILDLYRRHGRSAIDRFLLLVLGTFFIAYIFVTGAAQLGRYVIFLMPILAIGAARTARAEWSSGRPGGQAAIVAAALVFLLVNLGESHYRLNRSSPHALADAMTAPSRRSAATERMLERLQNPTRRPVVLGLEPIQVRYELDDRFVIRSTDGRTDATVLRATHAGNIDYAAYLRASDIDYFYLPPKDDHHRWDQTLERLARLAPGESTFRDGLRLTKLAGGALAVARQSRSDTSR